MPDKEYYSMTTKKFTLKSSHNEWLWDTWKFYNEILYFYYRLFQEHPELYGLDNQKAMRALERLSIVGRDKKPVESPLPWKGVPLYFRRAAINSALAAGKRYLLRSEQKNTSKMFTSDITLYKGMYRELDSHSVIGKVWNGEKWQWLRCRLYGNEIPESGTSLSPRVVFKEKRIELHVPVRENVADQRSLKQCLDDNMHICSVQFTNGDAIAVCCVLNRQYDVEAVRFFRGGRAYSNRCKNIWEKIKKSRKASGNIRSDDADKKYWKKLKNIDEDMTHQISRKIVDFSKENNVDAIILPKYDSEYSKYVMAAVGRWAPLRLSYGIRMQLKYKAWQNGIFVLESSVSDIGRYCAKCGADIHKKGDLFVCDHGHQGNRWVNAARNLGKKTYESLDKHMR